MVGLPPSEQPSFENQKKYSPVKLAEEILLSKKNQLFNDVLRGRKLPEVAIESTQLTTYINKFSQFIFDPGLINSCEISEDEVKKIREYLALGMTDSERKREGIQILNRNALIEVASNQIILGSNVAFINFDIKNLRKADNAGKGFAEILLRDFAQIIQTVAQKHQKIHLVPARIGGDEFCFFVSSKRMINIDILKDIYDEVKVNFNQVWGFFSDEKKKTLTKTKEKADLKEEKEDKIFAVANDRQSRAKFLAKALLYGQIPEQENINNDSNVNEREFKDLKEAKKKELDNLFDSDNLSQILNKLSEKHPEYTEEIALIRQLVKDGKKGLAVSLYQTMKNYFMDRLFGEEVIRFPDLIHYIVENKKEGRLLQVSIPWLKNLNHSLGYQKTNDIITFIYKNLPVVTGIDDITGNLIARGGGDFTIFIPKDKLNGKDIVGEKRILLSPNEDDEDISKILSEKIPFKDGIPVFFSSIYISESGSKDSVGQIIRNLQDTSKISLLKYFNELFSQDVVKAQQVVGYYLNERTEERKEYIRYWLGTLKEQLNQAFKRFLSAS